jgi:COP9 signalosome complex subunit 2
MSDDDDFMMEEDEEFDFEYDESGDENGEKEDDADMGDVGLENRYYGAKGSIPMCMSIQTPFKRIRPEG